MLKFTGIALKTYSNTLNGYTDTIILRIRVRMRCVEYVLKL